MLTCGFTPYYLAFPEKYTTPLMIFDSSMNILFLADIIINFLSAFHDSDYEVIDDFKVRVR